MGLPAQAPRDEEYPGPADRQDRGARERDRRDRAPDLAFDVGDGDADGDERDDLLALADRHDRADRGPERAGVLLGERNALGCVPHVSGEVAADELGPGVGVADAVEAHDDDEVDAGVLAHLLGIRLQHSARVGARDRLDDGRGVGHRARHRERELAGVGAAARPRVVGGQSKSDEHHEEDEERLEQEHLARQGAARAARRRHPVHSCVPTAARRPGADGAR